LATWQIHLLKLGLKQYWILLVHFEPPTTYNFERLEQITARVFSIGPPGISVGKNTDERDLMDHLTAFKR
jgi:hypothetical protein